MKNKIIDRLNDFATDILADYFREKYDLENFTYGKLLDAKEEIYKYGITKVGLTINDNETCLIITTLNPRKIIGVKGKNIEEMQNKIGLKILIVEDTQNTAQEKIINSL